VEGNCSAPGAPQNLRPSESESEAIHFHSHEFGFGPKRTRRRLLISSPNLALAHLLSPSPALRRPPGREETRAHERPPPPPRIPPKSPQPPAPSARFAAPRACPGPIPAGIRDKAAIFLRLLLSLPAPPFSFLTPPVCPFIAVPDCVPPSKGAVLGGHRSRIRLRRRRFDTRGAVFPQFRFVVVCVEIAVSGSDGV
jgi:hypothetical protein